MPTINQLVRKKRRTPKKKSNTPALGFNFNSSKLVQKYSDLAREALSSGDKILYENYLQHAEHFIRLSDNFTENSNSKDNSSKIANEVSINNVNDQNSKQDEKLKVKET